MVDQIFSYGELGFQEFETSKYIVGILRQNGCTAQEDYAGIPTAWLATWGSGKPVIALGADLDDHLEQLGVTYPTVRAADGSCGKGTATP